jgi:hypothetical protein
VSDQGLRHLQGLTALRELTLAGCAVTASGLAQLRVLPALTVKGLPWIYGNEDCAMFRMRDARVLDLDPDDTAPM